MRPGWPPPESLPAAGTRRRWNSFAELAVFRERTVGEALLVASLTRAGD